jgi:hypothetical protein
MLPIKAKRIADSILGDGFMSPYINRYYRYDHPRNIALNDIQIFAANIGSVWGGHLDITANARKLATLSKELNASLVIISNYYIFNANTYQFNQKFILCLSNTEYGLLWLANTGLYRNELYISKRTPYRYTDDEIKANSPPVVENLDRYKRENFRRIRLPNLKRFKGDAEHTPYWQMQMWFIDKLGFKKATVLWNNLYLRKEESDIMENNTRAHFKATRKRLHPLELDELVSWDSFAASPGDFNGNPPWSKTGYGYVKKIPKTNSVAVDNF